LQAVAPLPLSKNQSPYFLQGTGRSLPLCQKRVITVPPISSQVPTKAFPSFPVEAGRPPLPFKNQRSRRSLPLCQKQRPTAPPISCWFLHLLGRGKNQPDRPLLHTDRPLPLPGSLSNSLSKPKLVLPLTAIIASSLRRTFPSSPRRLASTEANHRLQQQPTRGGAHRPAVVPRAQETLPSPPRRDLQALADPSTATTTTTTRSATSRKKAR